MREQNERKRLTLRDFKRFTIRLILDYLWKVHFKCGLSTGFPFLPTISRGLGVTTGTLGTALAMRDLVEMSSPLLGK